MDRARVFIALLAYIWLSIPTALAQSTPEVGWWWNPDESGSGYFIESQGGVTYLAGYFYESDGHPVWLIAGGPNADPSFFRGRLHRYSGGQTLLGDYRPPAPGVDAGEVTLRFTDHRTGTLTWPGGTVPIQRYAFGPPPTGFQPDAGVWWNAGESGRGYNLEVQGDTLFVNAFLYDESGAPVWYLSAGKMTTPRRYEGAWLRFADGQTLGGTYRPPSPPVEVGRLAIEFLDDDEAVFTFTEPEAVATRSAAKAQRRIPVNRMFRFPRLYSGRFGYELQTTLPPNRFNVLLTTEYVGSLVRESAVIAAPLGCVDPPQGIQCKTYITAGAGSTIIRYSGDLGVVSCTGSFDEANTNFDWRALHVDVRKNGTFSFRFPFTLPRVWTFLANCKSNLPPYADLPYPMVAAIENRHVVGFAGLLNSDRSFDGSVIREISTLPLERAGVLYGFNPFD